MISGGVIGCVPPFLGRKREVFYRGDKRIEISPDKVEIMQFTGVYDRNGREIWEGDIARYNLLPVYEDHGWFHYGQVHFKDGAFWIRDETKDNLVTQEWEVVSNIYRGPQIGPEKYPKRGEWRQILMGF